jgi:NAD(P)-dependent dehydrogenase (short-subunit alcohol dehydrogenase family)
VNCISPGFIETDILDIHPKEWREKWYSMVPAQRFADTYELKGVSFLSFLQMKCSVLIGYRRMCFVPRMRPVI